MYFDELDLNDNVLDALYDMHFDECTPVQEQCIPHILKGKDILAVAQTGTGKTAAYLLPILSKLADGGYPEDAINCLIMSPTRELAQQIDQGMQGFSYYLNGVSCVAVYGGNDGNRYDQEIKSLALGADVIIATPGRFISHISLGNVDLSKVSFFVLDEADRMLDMGFSEDIKTIAKKLPSTCQTIMFSATMPSKIEDLAKTLLKEPEMVKLAVSKPAEKIQQSAYVCYETQKIEIIKDIFKAGDLHRVIIFSGSKQKVKQIASSLNRKHINCGEMHSDLDQAQRDDVMFKFKSGQIDVLVATDIVARGIDIDDITMVINYDVPHDVEDYVHRIGRTARADRDGVAITFVNGDDIYYFQQIESFLEKTIEKNRLPEALGEGPEYKSNGRPSKNKKAKNRRRHDRDQQSHKDKKSNYRRVKNRQEQPAPTDEKEQHKPQTSEKKSEKVQDKGNIPEVGAIAEQSKSRNNNRQKQRRNKEPKGNNELREKNNGASEKNNKARENNIKHNNKQANNNERRQVNNAENKVAKTKNNNKPKKKQNKKRFDQDNQKPRRSTKYDIREELPNNAPKESGIKALIKKPLKWLKGFGKK